MKTVQEIMSTDCVTLAPQDNMFDAALKMKQNDIGFIPVVEGNKLIGVVTDRDLVIRGLAEKKQGATAVQEVVTTGISTANPQTTIEEAAKLMANQKIRRLPVVEKGQLVGIVSIADLAVTEKFSDEAGQALSEISVNTDHHAATSN